MSDTDYSKPFRVRVTTDCRENPEPRLDGAYGFCLGLYEYPDITKRLPEDASEEGFDYNPLIITDSGYYIWGAECFWTDEPDVMDMPLDVLQDAAKLQVYLFEKVRSSDTN